MKKNPDFETERRFLPDRRREPTTIWNSVYLGGRRRQVRREFERRQLYFVDQFHWSILLSILLLLVFSLADGLITLELIDSGCVEVNPLMRFSLSHGPACFLTVKYLLTAIGLPVLVLFGVRYRAGLLISAIVALYAALIVYQVNLLQQLSGG
jgi:hypothetical protein